MLQEFFILKINRMCGFYHVKYKRPSLFDVRKDEEEARLNSTEVWIELSRPFQRVRTIRVVTMIRRSFDSTQDGSHK